MWPAIAILLAYVRDGFYRGLFLIVIAVRYALIAVFVLRWPDEIPRIAVAWKYSAGYVLAPVGLFLAGQLLIWLIFVRELRRQEYW